MHRLENKYSNPSAERLIKYRRCFSFGGCIATDSSINPAEITACNKVFNSTFTYEPVLRFRSLAGNTGRAAVPFARSAPVPRRFRAITRSRYTSLMILDKLNRPWKMLSATQVQEGRSSRRACRTTKL